MLKTELYGIAALFPEHKRGIDIFQEVSGCFSISRLTNIKPSDGECILLISLETIQVIFKSLGFATELDSKL